LTLEDPGDDRHDDETGNHDAAGPPRSGGGDDVPDRDQAKGRHRDDERGDEAVEHRVSARRQKCFSAS
jgi:hypothetical protein